MLLLHSSSFVATLRSCHSSACEQYPLTSLLLFKNSFLFFSSCSAPPSPIICHCGPALGSQDSPSLFSPSLLLLLHSSVIVALLLAPKTILHSFPNLLRLLFTMHLLFACPPLTQIFLSLTIYIYICCHIYIYISLSLFHSAHPWPCPPPPQGLYEHCFCCPLLQKGDHYT